MRIQAGAAATLAGFLSQPTTNGGPLWVVLLVAFLSCTFGMLSSASRLRPASSAGGWRTILLNAGAVYTAALILAIETTRALTGVALVGLGVGLAGTTILEVIERGAIAIAQRLAGVESPVSKQEFHEQLGDVRQKAQVAVSELQVKAKRGSVPPPDDEQP